MTHKFICGLCNRVFEENELVKVNYKGDWWRASIQEIHVSPCCISLEYSGFVE